jgi:hypothetical protein
MENIKFPPKKLKTQNDQKQQIFQSRKEFVSLYQEFSTNEGKFGLTWHDLMPVIPPLGT